MELRIKNHKKVSIVFSIDTSKKTYNEFIVRFYFILLMNDWQSSALTLLARGK